MFPKIVSRSVSRNSSGNPDTLNVFRHFLHLLVISTVFRSCLRGQEAELLSYFRRGRHEYINKTI